MSITDIIARVDDESPSGQPLLRSSEWMELKSDIDRLQSALRKIATRFPCGTADDMQRVAREALGISP